MKDVYSIKETICELQQQFYAREQLENESLSEYSHILMNKLFSLQKKSPDLYKDTDDILKQRFAEGVLDLSLKRELKRVNRESKALKFFQVRDIAISWIRDCEVKTTTESSELESLRQTVKLQEQKLEELTTVFKTQVHVSEQQPSFQRNRGSHRFHSRGRSRGRRYFQNQRSESNQNDNGNSRPGDSSMKSENKSNDDHVIICHYCQEPNHISPNCWKRKQDYKKRYSSQALSNSNHSS